MAGRVLHVFERRYQELPEAERKTVNRRAAVAAGVADLEPVSGSGLRLQAEPLGSFRDRRSRRLWARY